MLTAMVRGLVLIGALAIFGVAGCGDKPSKEQCSKLLDHMYKMDVQAATKSVTEAQKKAVEKQIREVKKDLRKKFMDQCVDRTPKGWVECALKAKDRKGIEECKS